MALLSYRNRLDLLVETVPTPPKSPDSDSVSKNYAVNRAGPLRRSIASSIFAASHPTSRNSHFAGIYVGNNQVVHMSPQKSSDIIGCGCWYRKPENAVVRTCLDCFLSGGLLYRYQYDSRSIVKRGSRSTTAKSDVPESVVRRAMHLLNYGFGDYHLVRNNCEDFALYCKTGLRIRNKSWLELILHHLQY